MNRTLPMILFTMLLTAVVAVSAAYADRPWLKWSPEDGANIRQGYHVEWYRGGEGRNAGNLAGEVAYIWSDCRNGDRGVYVQVIDVNGRLKFDNNGLKVSDAYSRQEDPQIWPSHDGGWFCAWEDFDFDSSGDIYCNKIDAQGRRLWGDGERGLAVCRMASIQMDVRIVEDGQGGCIIAWHDERGGDPGDLYAQHVFSDGRIDDSWPANGLPVVVAEGPQVSHTADEDGLGGMIIGWKDGRNVGNSDIWAQRITPDGQLRWGAGRGIVVCGQGANQEAPKVCPDGANGAFFTWVDDRNSETTGKDIYAQRVNSDGELLWPADGEAVCTEVQEQIEQRNVDSQAGEAIVLWEDKRSDGLTYDIYAMRISGAARMRKEWDQPQGVPIAVERRNQQQGRLFPDGQGGAYFCWEDERDAAFPEIDIWAQHFNRAGQPLWAVNGIPACRVIGNQNSPLIRRTADGGCVMAWGDYRTGSQEIWAQRLNANGQIQWAEDGIPLVAGIGGNAYITKAIYRGDGAYTALWLDSRFGAFGSVPFIQTIRDNAGQMETTFQQHGLPIIHNVNGGAEKPDGCYDGAGGTIVVWEDHRVNEIYSIYAQRINSGGDLLWGEGGVKIADYDYEQSYPKVCSSDGNGAIIAWRAPSDAGDMNIFIQKIDGNGQRLWGDNGRSIADDTLEEYIEELIPDGEGGAILTWMLTREDEDHNLDDDLYIVRVNADGQKVWGGADGRCAICTLDGRQRTSRISLHQEGFVVVWVDGREDHNDGQPGNDIFGQLFNWNGEPLWREQGANLCPADEHQDNPVVAVDNYGYIWVVWEDQRYSSIINGADIYGQKFNWHPVNGRPSPVFNDRLEVEGRSICGYNYNQVHPIIIHDGQNGLWVAWEDARGLAHNDIYGIHLNPRGLPYDGWEPAGSAVTTAFHRQISPQLSLLTPRGESGAAIVWEDKRATGKEELSNLFTQLMNAAPLAASETGASPPSSFTINSVYPNPFNPMTTASFTLPQSGLVKVSLFDVSGRLVFEPERRELTAGVHRMTIDGSNLASGQYVLRIEAAGEAADRSIHLLK